MVSCVIQVPKKKAVCICVNGLRPVAVTSVAVKVCPKAVLPFMDTQVSLNEQFLNFTVSLSKTQKSSSSYIY